MGACGGRKFKNGMQVLKQNLNDDSKICLLQGDSVCRDITKMQKNKELKTLECWVNPLGIRIKALQ